MDMKNAINLKISGINILRFYKLISPVQANFSCRFYEAGWCDVS